MNFKKYMYKLCYYSGVMVYWAFWGYFFFLIVYRSFIDGNIPMPFDSLYFLLLGLYLGYKLARYAYEYLKKNNGKF